MLTILYSRDWIMGRNAILNMIADNVKAQITGNILLVPDLVSHDMERRLCMAAGDSSSRFAEVLSFAGLARCVSDATGHKIPECMDQGGRLIAMAAAALQLHSKLKAYASVETKPEFLTSLIDAVDEFKCCCIRAEDLRQAAKQAQGSLAQKLEEIALLLDAYDALCARGKRDPRDQMTWLLEEMESSDFAATHHFFIDGFPDFTRQHMLILEHIIASDTNVVICMNCDETGSKDPAFEKAGRTALELIRFANRRGIAVAYQTVGCQQGPLAGLGQLLYQGDIQKGQYIGHLSTYRTNTIYDECCVVADKILEHVLQGARYRDIGIVCGDIETYRSTLSSVFDRCKIPSYLSGTEDILDKSVLNTILTAIDVATNGFDQKLMFRYLKSLFSPVDFHTCDQLENYAILWAISGNRWCKEWINHPLELNGKWNDHANNLLSDLNSARKRVMEPLVLLRDALTKSTTLKDQVIGVYQFLEDIHFADKLRKLSAQMESIGDRRNVQIIDQLWEIILTAMEQLHDTLGDTVWDAETFSRLFRLILSQYDVGTIPAVLDSVTIGPASAMRCHETKHLFVLGALEGQFPGCSATTGVLSDQERTDLRRLGVPVNGGSIDNLQVDFAEIYGVINGAHETISILCPSGQPSYVYKRLSELAGGEINNPAHLAAILTNAGEAAAYLARWEYASGAKILGIDDEYTQIIKHRAHEIGTITKENIHRLYGERLFLSASQIDRQAECRMSYFLKYGMRLKERKSATIDSAEFGTYVHAVMENTVQYVKDHGGFRQHSLQEVLDIAIGYSDAYSEQFFSQLDSERVGYLFRRNVHELLLVVRELWDEMQSCDFEPIGVEIGFGEGETLSAVDVSGMTMPAILSGFVDRVDVWETSGNQYFRVVDYKTGKKRFDYCDVFNGIGLQMLLYLFALESEGKEILGDNPHCAGVQYFPARASFISLDGVLSETEIEKKREAEWVRQGLILNDKDVVHAMENSDHPKRLPISITKDGRLTGDLADREQFRRLKAYVFKQVGKMVDDIASGNVSPNPYTRGSEHSACMYCPYSAICHRAQVEDIRNYKAMKADDFWTRIGKEDETDV